MLYDASATDTLFADGRPPREDMGEVLAWARERLGLNGSRPWRLLSARHKMGKTLFEIEETCSGYTRRLIGKLCKTERAEVLDRALKQLWDAGFRPPARHTVTEPIAILPERGFILQERAPGVDGRTLLFRTEEDASIAARHSAEWLAALHAAPVRATAGLPDPDQVGMWVRELSATLPAESARLGHIEDAVLRELVEPVRDTVPCHGDFHPMNIYIQGNGRVTGIDLDKFSQREPEFDVGYCIAQTAAFGFLNTGRIDATLASRRVFLNRYREVSGRELCARRAAMHVAMTFLKNLHFELVLLRTERMERADPWLAAAEAAILDENLDLVAASERTPLDGI